MTTTPIGPDGEIEYYIASNHAPPTTYELEHAKQVYATSTMEHLGHPLVIVGVHFPAEPPPSLHTPHLHKTTEGS